MKASTVIMQLAASQWFGHRQGLAEPLEEDEQADLYAWVHRFIQVQVAKAESEGKGHFARGVAINALVRELKIPQVPNCTGKELLLRFDLVHEAERHVKGVVQL